MSVRMRIIRGYLAPKSLKIPGVESVRDCSYLAKYY